MKDMDTDVNQRYKTMKEQTFSKNGQEDAGEKMKKFESDSRQSYGQMKDRN